MDLNSDSVRFMGHAVHFAAVTMAESGAAAVAEIRPRPLRGPEAEAEDVALVIVRGPAGSVAIRSALLAFLSTLHQMGLVTEPIPPVISAGGPVALQ